MEDLSKIRNIGIAAHIDAGKTTTTERVLYYSGTIHKMGDVDDGTTITDFDVEEQQRGITIYSAAVSFDWRDCRVNLIDTPGHVDFTAEVERSLRVLDGAVVVFDAKEGVEAQSETVWRQADKYHVPRVCFLNKMDKTGADFHHAVQTIRTRLAGHPILIHLPLGQENTFRGYIDLIAMRAVDYSRGDDGTTFDIGDIPPDLATEARAFRHLLEEQVAELDDRLMAKYVDNQPMEAAEIRAALRQGTIARLCQPVLCGSALRYIGVQAVLDAVCDYLPSPLDIPPVAGHDPEKPEKVVRRKCDPGEPLCALVFKIVAEPHADLHFVRVYSGVLKAGSRVLNTGRHKKENVPQLFRMFAKRREKVERATCGDIVAAVGLKDTQTGDTLCDTHAPPVLLERIEFPETVISMAIEPQSTADRDKLLATLQMLSRSDPTFEFHGDAETGQTLISGMGELHLEVKCHLLEREFHIPVRVGKPRVAYREAITRAAEAEGRFIRQTGARGHFAVVKLRVEPFTPQPGEEHFKFANELHAGAPGRSVSGSASGPREQSVSGPASGPRERSASGSPSGPRARSPSGPRTASYVPAIEQAVRDASRSGILGSYPLINVKVTLLDAEERAAESSEIDFESAATMAFQRAVEQAGPVLLEPIMKVEVVTPEEYYGAINGDLMSRRATITAAAMRGNNHVITAEVPLSTMFGYATQVRSLSQGRASHSMEPCRYERMPPDLARKVLGVM